LFSELLQKRLENSEEFSVKTLHRKASEWFANENMLEESIDHAFAIQDYDLVIQRIEKSLNLIMAQGQFRNYLAWVERIPHEMLLEKPRLDVVKIFMLHEMGRLDERIRHQQYVEENLGFLPENLDECSSNEIANHGILAAIKTIIYASSDFSIDDAYKNAELANQLLSRGNIIWRTLSAGAIPFMNRALGYYELAISGFSGVLEQVLDANFFFQAFITYSVLTKAYLETNQLKLAMITCQKAIDLDLQYGGSFPFAKLVYLLMGELMYQNGQLNSAEAYIEMGLDHVIRHGDVYSIIDGYSILMLIQIANGDQEQALALLDEMKAVLSGYSPSPNALKIIRFWETYIRVFLGQWKKVDTFIDEPDFELDEGQYLFDLENHSYVGIYRVSQNPIKIYTDFFSITTARLYLARNELKEGLRTIEGILSGMAEGGCTKYLIEAQIVKALILDGLNKKSEAMQTLQSAIQIAAVEGYFQVFINEGLEIERLLQELKRVTLEDIEQQVFVLQLLETIHLKARQHPGEFKSGIDPLTPREIEVLKCLASGPSYALAAETLSISRNTLKTHTKRIYQKLGVNGLLQALNKAKELNILQ
jgi:LuxR family maltose regulon positive regulatory protein